MTICLRMSLVCTLSYMLHNCVHKFSSNNKRDDCALLDSSHQLKVEGFISQATFIEALSFAWFVSICQRQTLLPKQRSHTISITLLYQYIFETQRKLMLNQMFQPDQAESTNGDPNQDMFLQLNQPGLGNETEGIRYPGKHGRQTV